MIKVYVATALSFFFPGSGNFVLGVAPVAGALWLLGAVGLTWVELSLQGHPMYWAMFGSVFLMNTGFAVYTFQTGRALQSR